MLPLLPLISPLSGLGIIRGPHGPCHAFPYARRMPAPDIGKASQGLAMAIRRIFEKKRHTPFLQKVVLSLMTGILFSCFKFYS